MEEQQPKTTPNDAKTPLVSVILPVYNAALFLPETLRSLRAQTVTDWECLCVDDGSSDASPDILRRVAAEDPRFTVLSQPNSGPGPARNAALDLARGTWLCFLDADDVLHPRALETLLASTDDTTDLIRCAFTRMKDGLSDVGTVTDVKDPVHVMCTDKRWPGVLWGALWRRSTVGDLRFLPWKNHEDVAWTTEATLRLRGMRHHSAPLYDYRSTGGISTRFDALETLPRLWSFQAKRCPQIIPLLGEFAVSYLKYPVSSTFWRKVAALRRQGLLSWQNLSLSKRYRLWKKFRAVKAKSLATQET